MTEIGNLSDAHEEEIAGRLAAAQRTALADTLQALVTANGLTAAIHTGYKSLGRTGTRTLAPATHRTGPHGLP